MQKLAGAGNSVPACRVTANCGAVNVFRHSRRFVNLANCRTLPVRLPLPSNCTIFTVAFASPGSSSSADSNWQTRSRPANAPTATSPAAPKINPRRVRSFIEEVAAATGFRPLFPLITGAGKSGGRFGSPRAPRTSSSSNSSDGATIEAGRPFCAEPNAPSAVPANTATWLCM